MKYFSFELFFGVGAALLAIGIAWGVIATYRRNRANIAVTEEAVRQRRAHPETYEDQIKPELEKKLKP